MMYCQSKKQEGSGHLVRVEVHHLLSGPHVELYDVIPNITDSFNSLLAAIPCRKNASREASMVFAAQRLETAIQDMDALLVEAAAECQDPEGDRSYWADEDFYEEGCEQLVEKAGGQDADL